MRSYFSRGRSAPARPLQLHDPLIGLLMFSLLAVVPCLAAERQVDVDAHSYWLGSEPAWVERRPLPALPEAAQPGESIDYLLIERQHRLDGARSAYYLRVAMHLLTEQAVADVAQLPISFDPDFQRLVLHRLEVQRDGVTVDRLEDAMISMSRRESQFEAGFFTGTVTLLALLRDIRVGDVLHYSYSIEGANPIHAEVSGGRYSQGFPWPVRHAYLRVLLPDGREPRLSGDALSKLVQRDVEGGRELIWERSDLPPVRVPDLAPVWFEPSPVLEIGGTQSWQDLVEWGLELYGQADDPDQAIERLAAEITAGAADDEQRIVRLLRFAQDDVRYFAILLGDSTHKPNPASEVAERRFGDCKDKSTLLVALLRAQGFEAWPALVSMERQRGILDSLPGAHVFDHVIVLLQWQDRQYWLDPTMNLQRGGLDDIGFADYGAALPLREGQSALISYALPADYKRGGDTLERLLVQSEGTAELHVTTRLWREGAEYFRRSLASGSLEQLAEGYLEFYQRMFGDAERLAMLQVSDDTGSNRIDVDERYRLDDLWNSSAQSGRYLDLYAHSLSEYLPMESSLDRVAPRDLGWPGSWTHTFEVQLPLNWNVQQAPKALDIQGHGLRLQRQVDQRDNTLHVRHVLERQRRIVPENEWREVRSLIRSMREELSTRIVLADTQAAPASTRRERLQNLVRGIE